MHFADALKSNIMYSNVPRFLSSTAIGTAEKKRPTEEETAAEEFEMQVPRN